MTLNDLKKKTGDWKPTEKLPTLFVGHGNPMNAIENNRYSMAWDELGKKLPHPKAILSVSAHWLTEGTAVHVAKQPRIIHDFWGFPKELYDIRYPCPGSPEYAREAKALIKKTKMVEDETWGLDHGTWVVTKHLFPKADIPVFQLSIDIHRPADFHYALGKELAPLRERGVCIIGSGNIVHNLDRLNFDQNVKPFDWAVEFDERSGELLAKADDAALINYEKLGNVALLSIPTPDHYWPLLYVIGARTKNERMTCPVEGIAHGSVSMRAVLFG